MATRPILSCPHELRPGTTVCLHCRREAQRASSERRHRRLVRLGAVLAVLVVVATGANALVNTFPGGLERLRAILPTAEHISAPTPVTGGTSAVNGTAPASLPRVSGPREASAAPVVSIDTTARAGTTAGPTPERRIVRPLQPILAQGRSELRDSLFAIRADSTVTVFFDRPLTRTRRHDKFERLVRATLPEVYGPAVDSVLAAIPEGSLARDADLLTELPVKGVHLALADQWTLALYPETRPGVEGPLVIRYRTLVTRNAEQR